MRIRPTLSALVVVATAGASMVAASGLARAQTPLAPCPTGRSLSVAVPTVDAPSVVTVTITPALTNLKAAGEADPASVHLHYFVNRPATAAGEAIPTGNAQIIHSGSLTQDLGVDANPATVEVVVGQLDHVACDLRGSVSFTVPRVVVVAPPASGNGGLLGQASESASSPLALAALGLATLVAVSGAAVATRRR